jgi:formate dehydrogenase subunit gamma
VHRATAVLFGVCMATAAVLYLSPLAILVGRRDLVQTVHLYSGLALPVPTLLGWLSAAFRRDAAELNRFTAVDGAWLRDRVIAAPLRAVRGSRARWASGGADQPTTRRSGQTEAVRTGQTEAVRGAVGRLRVGKFNAGQKLYAAGVTGAVLVFLGTGLVMQFGGALPIRYRTGATFVHDLFAYGIAAAVFGHLWMASRDPIARAGMRTGWVPAWWAALEHPGWRPEPEPHRDPDPDDPFGTRMTPSAVSSAGADGRSGTAGTDA